MSASTPAPVPTRRPRIPIPALGTFQATYVARRCWHCAKVERTECKGGKPCPKCQKMGRICCNYLGVPFLGQGDQITALLKNVQSTGEISTAIPDLGPLHLAVLAGLGVAASAPESVSSSTLSAPQAVIPRIQQQNSSSVQECRHLPANVFRPRKDKALASRRDNLFNNHGIDEKGLKALPNDQAADPYSADLYDRMVARTVEATAIADARGDHVYLPFELPEPGSNNETSDTAEEDNLDPGPWEYPGELWGSP
ncbi:hypothetical protein DL95DRAFT_405721 [Leptodontidium sp. 2 PMI_412]|nr:hypothetical protein DL95DRAFT_405721 [Leptodontidium sp. 2 PMI_412]